MNRQAKSRLHRLVLAGIVALAILLLLLRLFVFVHGRRGFRGARSGAPVAMGMVRAASQGTGSGWSERAWSDRVGDGTPDFLRRTARVGYPGPYTIRENVLILLALGYDGFFLFQQFGQSPFRADVPGLKRIQLLVCLHRVGNGHEAEQAAGIVSAVLVLGAAVHRSSPDAREISR
jgi:hypothetical protein